MPVECLICHNTDSLCWFGCFVREERQRTEALKQLVDETCCRTRTFTENKQIKLTLKKTEPKRKSKLFSNPISPPVHIPTQAASHAASRTSLIEPITPDGVSPDTIVQVTFFENVFFCVL